MTHLLVVPGENVTSSYPSNEICRRELINIEFIHPQVLSPISDKSQEQGSSESQSTPKASPNGDDANANIEVQCDNQESEMRNDNERANYDLDDSDGIIAQALDVPWEVPKLRRRIQRSKGSHNLVQHQSVYFIHWIECMNKN